MQVIAAEGEQKASGALKAAADVISESSNALQVNVGNLQSKDWDLTLTFSTRMTKFESNDVGS